ncbi:AAA family ATPase [Glycomyces xiaoerkulensis]|uniref:AAA family ATPase n=1 Tax=Glycomyces xiaoerkulensis TaxID=2038139 RepID=UPI001E341E12|nr:AAA family ATPase [Glycomyces xiaoerkulensis]
MAFDSSPAQPPQAPPPSNPQEFKATAEAVLTNVEWVIEGKAQTIRLALAVMLAEGHLLLEDVPGVGKTQLAKALARSVDCSVRRIQFTPDLLPSDVTGVSVFDPEKRDFVFKPGAVFGNLILGDEINRASPKTQAALLECMEERQVTIDGNTYRLRSPFMVIATQNPVEMEGTYPLPEAQRDRFAARLAIGYPDVNAEMAMLDHRGEYNPLESLQPVCNGEAIVRMIATARAVHVSPELKRYAVDLVNATRSNAQVRLGASPRATLQLLRCAQVLAAMDGREFALPDDVQQLAVPVLAHRLIPTTETTMGGGDTTGVVADILRHVPVVSRMGRF